MLIMLIVQLRSNNGVQQQPSNKYTNNRLQQCSSTRRAVLQHLHRHKLHRRIKLLQSLVAGRR